MERQGIAVPGQIAVMGVDNTIYGEICKPQLSTLDNKLVEVSLQRLWYSAECSGKESCIKKNDGLYGNY